MRLALPALVLLMAATLASGCTRRATQLMLVVESDLSPSSYACIGIEVVRLQGGTPVMPSQFVGFRHGVADVPFSLGVLPPGGDASVRVEIRAEAHARRCDDPNVPTSDPPDPPVVRSVLRAGFAPEQTLRLPVFLAALCTGVTCSDGESCSPRTGMCEPVVVQDPGTLMPVHPGEELPDGGAGDAGPVDASIPHDGNLDRGQCPLEGNDYVLGDAPNRVFGLAITQPSDDWVILYSDASALHAVGFAYDHATDTALPAWDASEGADAIALEGLPLGNAMIALVNPTGSTDLVRYVGPTTGAPPARSVVGTGRLVQRGRHSALFGGRIATVVERDAGVAVVAIGATDQLADLYVSPAAVDVALGNTAGGDLVVAISGTQCELRTYDAGGTMIDSHSVAVAAGETCHARAVTTLDDGHYALVYATSTLLKLSLSTPTTEMSLRLNPSTHVATVAGILGHDDTYRVVWSDVYDRPPEGTGGDEPGIILQTSFAIGSTGSEYSDHGDATTDHDLTRWERLGDRTAIVMVPRSGFLFRSICRPTPE